MTSVAGGADGERLRVVGRADARRTARAVVAGREDRDDPGGTSAWRSGWKARLQPGVPYAHELLTICGASAVAGSPSGSRTHWRALWIAVAVAVPLSLKILAAIQVAPGAMPIDVPPASPPTMTPIVAVPWPLRSVGVDGCWPYGSNQEVRAAAPARRQVRVSDVHARVQVRDDDALARVPEGPQRRGVDERDVRPRSEPTKPVPRPSARGRCVAPAGTIGTSSGSTLCTSARAAISAIAAGVAVTDTPLVIQNALWRATRPVASRARNAGDGRRCAAVAWARRARMMAISRPPDPCPGSSAGLPGRRSVTMTRAHARRRARGAGGRRG